MGQDGACPSKFTIAGDSEIRVNEKRDVEGRPGPARRGGCRPIISVSFDGEMCELPHYFV